MKTNTYLCVNLKTRMQQTHIQTGEYRKGILSMPINGENFEFDETLDDPHRRNPKVWRGETLNVARTSDGNLLVNFRRIELTTQLDAQQLGYRIAQELLTAKNHLQL